jgi:hypothetical protein
MIRALIELLLVIFFAMVARAILTSIFKSLAQASANAFQQTSPDADGRRRNENDRGTRNASELHRDPVCGTYVAESTPFRLQVSGATHYYCSDACRQAHIPVAH